jgi:hypothetical protein
MYANTADLLKLDQPLYGEKLLDTESKKLMAVSYPQYNYTGVWNYHYPFVTGSPTIMEQRWGIGGANVGLVRLTDAQETIITLSNDNRFNPDSFGDENNLREMLIRVLSKKEG